MSKYFLATFHVDKSRTDFKEGGMPLSTFESLQKEYKNFSLKASTLHIRRISKKVFQGSVMLQNFLEYWVVSIILTPAHISRVFRTLSIIYDQRWI